MSLTEIKRQVRSLSLEQRLDLADYLARQAARNKAALKSRIDRRMRVMDRGRKITQEQVLALHTALKAAGL